MLMLGISICFAHRLNAQVATNIMKEVQGEFANMDEGVETFELLLSLGAELDD